jgi:hypothetical protein
MYDKAYSSKKNRSYLRKRKINTVIPEKRDQQANWRKLGAEGGRPPGSTLSDAGIGTPGNAASTC